MRAVKSFERPISWYEKRNKTLEKPHRLANTERSGQCAVHKVISELLQMKKQLR